MKGKNMNEDGTENSHDCLDLSILRKPITTSISGFSEVRKAYDNGTEEIRQLLSNECDIVYECRVCRNIFRSLANFISHKRVYCRQKFNASQHFHFPSNGFINQDISTIIQAEEEFTNYSVKDKPPEIVSKDLSSIIERLTAKKSADRMAKLSDFYDRVSHKLTQNDVLKRDHTIQLERPANTSVAVYQTVKESSDDSIKMEVEEVRDLLLDNEVVLGPDGKAIKTLDRPNLPVIYSLDDLDATLQQTLSCKICHLKFATEKTLKLHLEAKHLHSTYVYQCPSCPQTFLVPAAVIRHLSNDHKKSLKRIRMMRDTIYKRRVRMDEIQVKGPSRELVRLQTDRERQEADNKAWVENVENYDAGHSVCTYCGKSFERRAVLTTHLANCRQKQKSSTVTSAMIKKSEKLKKSAAETTKEISSVVVLTQQDENSNSFDSCTTNASANKEIIQSNLHNKLNVSIDGEAADSDNSNEKGEGVKDIVMVTPPPANKRKRKRAAKIAEETSRPGSAAAAEEIYWSMDEGGELSMKKFAKEAENLPPPPPPTSSPNAKEKPEVKLPECDICCKTFVTKSNLKRHNVMFHYFKNRFLCKLCDFGANKKLDLISHLGTKHNIMGDKHVVKEFITLAKEENRAVVQDEPDDQESTPTPVPVPNVLSSASKSLPSSLCPSPLTIEPTEDSTSNSSSVPDGGSAAPKRRGRPPGSRKIKTSPTMEMTTISPKTGRNSKDDTKSPKEGKDKKNPAENIPKRPIRNRVKPVNKDFVYDLSHLLKKESDIFKGIFMEQQSTMTKKRGKSSQNSNPPTPPVQATAPVMTSVSVEKPKPSVLPEVTSPPIPPQNTPQVTPTKDIKIEESPLKSEIRADLEYKIEVMKGAAFNMAKAEVALHTASLSTVPPMIVERPAIPGLFPMRSPEEDAGKTFTWGEKSSGSGIQKKTKRIPKQSRRISDDILIKGARKQIKRRRKHSTPVLTVRSPIRSPEYRRDDEKAHSDDVAKPDSTSELKSRHTEKDFQDFLLANLKEYSSTDSSPLIGLHSNNNPLSFMNSNGKRITLLQRLAENKSKRSDAVHRLSDPFGTDSSDEN